jgi:ABC-2 type transport system ATP-binding protein
VNAIETVGLSKHFPRGGAIGRFGPGWRDPIEALEAVTLAVRPGEIFGFLGPNGAGKSTCIRLLLGFLHPTAGSARVLGLDTRSDGVAIRARVGYLPGGIALYDAMTGAALLDYLAAFYDRPPALRPRLLDGLELAARDLARPVRDYSRGMRQKLGIVQALQHDPEVAILDEPSEGLDPLMQRAFYAILDDLRAAGRTVFLSSHILSEVEALCDRVGILRAGELVDVGTLQDLRHLSAHTVELTFEGAPPALAEVSGVEVLSRSDGRVRCSVTGSMEPLIDALHGSRVVSMTSEEPSLEEVFLRYYGSKHDG